MFGNHCYKRNKADTNTQKCEQYLRCVCLGLWGLIMFIIHYAFLMQQPSTLLNGQWEGGPFSSFTLWKERVSEPSEHRPPANPVCLWGHPQVSRVKWYSHHIHPLLRRDRERDWGKEKDSFQNLKPQTIQIASISHPTPLVLCTMTRQIVLLADESNE